MTGPGAQRGRGPATDNACGTYRGYYRHWRRGAPVTCKPCLLAMAQHQEDQRLAPARRALLDDEVAIYDRQHRRERAS